MDTIETQNAGWRQTFSWIALGLAVFSVIWFAAAALGTKFGLWDWQFGLVKMTIGWGPFVVMSAIGLAVLGLLFSVFRVPRRRSLTETVANEVGASLAEDVSSITGLSVISSVFMMPQKKPFMLSLAALVIAGGMLGRLLAIGAGAASLPPIHDVQTNWSNPIMFSDELMAIRKASGAMNDVTSAPVIKLSDDEKERWPGYDGKTVAEAQESMEQDPAKAGKDDDEKPYLPINTLAVEKPKAEVLAAIKTLIEKRGWAIVTEATDPALETGVFEATHTSGWFGFKDDVAIHVLAGPDDTSIVDMRSVSRVGLSDIGANAKRVGNFMRDLRRVTAG